MFNFIKAVKEALEEQNKTTADLFKDNIVSENTFYKYNKRNPSLDTLIKIANYLKVSIDYLYELDNINNYQHYSIENIKFYDNLVELIKSKNISFRQFCKDLNYSKDNILRWRKGIKPSVQCLFEISKYFNCSIDDLIQSL